MGCESRFTNLKYHTLLLECFRGKITEFKAIVSKQICWMALCSKAISVSGLFEVICWAICKKHGGARGIRIGLEVGRYRQVGHIQ